MDLYHSCFNHSSADGHLGWFRVLGTVNSAAANTGMRVSFQPGIVIAEPCGTSVASFLRSLQPIIQSEVCQNEKYRILTHIYGHTHTQIYTQICGIYKDGTDEPIFRAAVEIQT